MTLTKDRLTRGVREQVRFRRRKRERQQWLFPELRYQFLTRRRASQIVESLFEIIKKTLEKGDNVRITGFGRFQVIFKWARKGINPRTGKQIVLNSKRIVSFRPSAKLKKKITQGDVKG